MEDVYVVAVGRIPALKANAGSLECMAASAIAQLFEPQIAEPEEVGALYVGNMLSGILSQQQLLAPLIAQHAGLSGCEAVTTEAACASGAAAMRLGFMAVASGQHSVVVVVGVEQMSRNTREEVSRGLATASCWEQEGSKGETFITLNAKLMDRYLKTYRVERTAFAPFAVQAHQNALNNSCAMLHKAIDKEDYANGRILAEPISLFDAPPICDGAAALLLGDKGVARRAMKLGFPVAKVIASTSASDALAIADRADPLELRAAHLSARSAYRMAGLMPGDINVFEPHDAYTVITALSLEAAGFAERGQATTSAAQGKYGMDGCLPITTFGGLKARGHPVGATGIYQIAECFLQLTDSAGELQIPNAQYAMSQNLGGAAGSAFTHILERV